MSHGVVADKQCTCFASKQIWERYPSTPPFYCGVNEIQASLISSASVGATPTPATNFQNLTARPPTRVSGPVFLGSGVLLPVRSHQRVAWRQRTRLGAGNSRRAQAPGAIPAALTNLDCRRGLIDQPAVPLPGGVKVVPQRGIKPPGVGASPTLAAIYYHPRRVAQKQSHRLITGRPRSITARDDQLTEGELRPPSS